ncbi:MAG TPA: glycoside hydrolase family 16 protein [Blastocatellia bacterium]|nr:glycoside hydrolase family 16 protein [Blastocatellia bacterium]
MKQRAIKSLRILKLAILSAFIFLPIASADNASAQTWTLVWSDEFDGPAGSAPNSSKWGYDIGGGGWGNKELETYTNRTQNASLDGDGNLVIQAIKETFTGSDRITRDYTSARLLTKGKFEQRYGRFEARMKLPFGQGIWPAFWMLGDDIDNVGWPRSGEIDIMENIGREPAIAHGTLHGPGYSGGNGLTGSYTLPNDQRFSDAFHVFAVEWEPNAIRFYVDKNLYGTKTQADVPAGNRWVYDHPFFIIMNVAVGGIWPGNPDSSTQFPQVMKVDYVRVYADARTIPAITSVSIKKKDLIVTGENFDAETVILLNGKKQKTARDDQNLSSLTGKKMAKKIDSGQAVKIQVRNSNNVVSAEYSYTKP